MSRSLRSVERGVAVQTATCTPGQGVIIDNEWGQRDERHRITRWPSLSRLVVLRTKGNVKCLRGLACRMLGSYNTSAHPSDIHRSTSAYLTRWVVPFARSACSPLHVSAFRVSSSKPDGPSNSPVQPDLPAVFPAVYQHRHVLVRLGHLGQHRQHYESTNRANRPPTHPSIAHRRTRRPSSAASRAESPGQSAGGACAGARCTAWRVIALRLIRAGAAPARGRCGASTFRSGVSASNLRGIYKPWTRVELDRGSRT